MTEKPGLGKWLSACCALCLVALSPLMAAETDDDIWHFDGELFLWGAGIGGSSVAGDIDVSFDTILDDLEMAFMGTFAASRNRWAFAAEVIYLDVGDGATIATSPVEISADVDMASFISTIAGGYRLAGSDAASLHGVFGARYLSLDVDLDLTIGGMPDVPRSRDEGIWDGVIGIRGHYGFTDHWVLTYYGDIGTGDSDLTWHAVAAINYRWKRVALVLGYAHLEWEFDDSSLVRDLDISGPYAGVQFRFH